MQVSQSSASNDILVKLPGAGAKRTQVGQLDFFGNDDDEREKTSAAFADLTLLQWPYIFNLHSFLLLLLNIVYYDYQSVRVIERIV